MNMRCAEIPRLMALAWCFALLATPKELFATPAEECGKAPPEGNGRGDAGVALPGGRTAAERLRTLGTRLHRHLQGDGGGAVNTAYERAQCW